MPPEQEEQWQQAVMLAYPAPVPGGQECTLEQWQSHRNAEAAMAALLPEAERKVLQEFRVEYSVEHLAGWQLPDWTIKTRDFCIRRYYSSWKEDFSAPVPELAFRSDVALIGIQLRYPTPEARGEPYQRLLIGFLKGALRPLVEYAEASDDTDLRHDLEGFAQICRLCESDSLYRDPQRWLDIRNDCCISRTRMSSRSRAYILASNYIRAVRYILFQIDDPDPFGSKSISLFSLYVDYEEFNISTHPIAEAFLEALEAECPPPDWLPKA